MVIVYSVFIKYNGTNRFIKGVDCVQKKIKLASGAEDKFIELFSEVFGPEKTGKLLVQYGVNDIYGASRYLDFAIVTDKEKIAIEIDGEGVHEPGKVSH